MILLEFIGVILAFVVILILITKKVNLGLSMFVGTAIIYLLKSDSSLIEYLFVLKKGLFDETTLTLVIVIANITIMAGIMEKTGLINQMISSMRVLFKRMDIIMVLVPSILGILTVPGGAMISAPIVDKLGDETDLNNAQKMVINLLFRHVWYFSFPYVPGLILTANIIGTDINFVIRHLYPLTITLLVAGYLNLLFGMKTKDNINYSHKNKYRALINLIIIMFPIIIGILLPIIFPIPFWVSLTVGLGVLFIIVREKLSWNLIVESINWNMIFGIIGIMVFKECINSLSFLQEFTAMILDKGMPIWLLAIILPALVAFLTGSTAGSIGVTLPLLVMIIDFKINPEYLVLMYGSSFFAYYLSPVHLCLILTAEYFKVDFKEVYTFLLWPTLIGILMNIALYFIYS